MKHILKYIIVFIITLEARLVLKKYKPEIVAVTGSVGKTGVKDAIYAVLSRHFYAWKGEKSFNSEIGIPLSVLGLENAWGSVSGWLKIIFEGIGLIFLKNHYPKILVVEVGTDRPGDIEKLMGWLKPDVVVVTAFPEVPVHVEFFSSREALIEEKTHVVRALKSQGLLILNADDSDVCALKKLFPHNTLTFGENQNADIRIMNSQVEYDDNHRPFGMFGKISYLQNQLPIHIKGVLGAHMFTGLLAALAVGIGKGINIVSGVESLADFSPPPGRMRILNGIHDSVIIDDSYNASPTAVHAALNALESIHKPVQEFGAAGMPAAPVSSPAPTESRKIAVLGDMLELGKHAAEEHKKIGARIPEVCDELVTVGIRAQFIDEAAEKKKMKQVNRHHFENSIEAGEFLKDFVRERDIILVKGSQSIRMERVVSAILKNSEDKKLLVRQEEAWQRKI